MRPVQLPEDDAFLEQDNEIFWASLLEHIRREFYGPVDGVVDVGCHHGGLLAQLAAALHPNSLTGIEPASRSRERALFRLKTLAPSVKVLTPERWSEVPPGSIDVLTCHEVLHLLGDLSNLFANIDRVLRVGGRAFVVAGCHTENPLWHTWSTQLRDAGQTVFDHAPFDILRAGISAGLHGSLRPLRSDGWIIHDPDKAIFTYPSASELLEHQYRHKLLFRFLKQS